MAANDNHNEGGSTVLVNEKGKNKRKFLSDQLTLDSTTAVSKHSLTEFPRYENLLENFNNEVGEFRAMAQRSGETTEEDTTEEDDDGFESDEDSEWDDDVVFELQGLLAHNIFITFCYAVKKIMEYGYTAEVAEWVILNSRLILGNIDPVTNVVEPALAFLRKQKEFSRPKHSLFPGLDSLVNYTLLEMVSVIREVRPDLTLVDVMWALLVSDLSLMNACSLVSVVPTVGSSSQEASKENQSLPQFITEASHSESRNSGDTLAVKSSVTTQKGSLVTIPEAKGNSTCVDDKLGGSKEEGLSSNSEMDLLQQKIFQFDKNNKGHFSKGTFKAKVAAWGSMVLDKSLKLSQSVSLTSSTKGISSSKITPPMDRNASAKIGSESKGENSVPDTHKVINCTSILMDETLQKHVPQDTADETIRYLVSHKKMLENDLQKWTDWGNEKVMQAARRLGKDKAELKMLKQEKEEMEKYKRDKQMMEENTMKRLSEMEYALSNATGQIEVARRAVHRLEQENDALMSEMKAAKDKAVRSAEKLGEALKKEQEYQKRLQTSEAEKGLLHEQLMNVKRQAAAMNTRVEKSKARMDQFKTLLKQEERENLKVRKELEAIAKKKEEDEALTRAEEQKIKQLAELDMKKYEEDIKNLQNQISKLRLESDKSKIAALMGYDNFPAPKTTENSGGDVIRERECVMCMTDEIAVVFLPCAHQVFCKECSSMHENQGMNDCPSCRTIIQKRITVAYRGG